MRLRLPATVRAGADWLKRLAATTPGVIASIAVAAVVLCLTSGLVCANDLSDKTSRRDNALTHSEPQNNAAQNLYVALSQADASAATAFLSGGIESPQIRSQYQQALADAAAALATATAGANDPQIRGIVANIAADLPAYTGLVESARANNRQGFPIGSAYLREASGLMQNSLLPNAAQLATQRAAALRADQDAISGPPVLAIFLLLVVLVGAVVASRMLLQRTNRLFNVGITAAAGAAALALVWIAIATIVSTSAIDTGSGGPTTRSEDLAQARILGQQARTDEMLELITRGDTTGTEADFANKTGQLRILFSRVARADSPVRRDFSQWVQSHGKQVDYYNAANYPAAVAQAIGTAPTDSSATFTALDDSVRADLARTRVQVREQIASAGDSWIGSAAGTLVLLVFAAGAAVVGLWPRLKEFQ
ncbi:hypothetical protein [Nocardia macrotermitis]|uniref:Secreted protein n=1 Tax=Nocardia macrotermitis TaxID=2585198 RepID=A0A7K0D0L4_9NOCA|nr:hypothetical protein [Nocardia macrotermitis]MQY19250.1 hypothetical protein [Nocardia macrotermitis]